MYLYHYVDRSEVLFTFWSKEGSIARFVAVRPSVVLPETETPSMQKHSDLKGMSMWGHILLKPLVLGLRDAEQFRRARSLNFPLPWWPSPGNGDTVDELGTTLQCGV